MIESGTMRFVAHMVGILGVLACFSAPPAALAQDDVGLSGSARARAEFEAGRVAYDEARYEEALTRFETAYELSGRGELLYNVGLSAEHLGRTQTAIDSYDLFLSTVSDAPEREDASARLDRLRSQERANTAITEPSDDDGDSVFGQWWFWTAIGVVIAGAVVTTLLLTQDDDGPMGEGGVVFTLH